MRENLAQMGISIHALREEGDRIKPNVKIGKLKISIHALREEGDSSTTLRVSASPIFLSTPSARRATAIGRTSPWEGETISIHALREEGDLTCSSSSSSVISIHALREEGDPLT